MTDRKDSGKSERDESTEEYRSDSTTSTGPEDTAAQVAEGTDDECESPAEQAERERRERGFGVGNRSQ